MTEKIRQLEEEREEWRIQKSDRYQAKSAHRAKEKVEIEDIKIRKPPSPVRSPAKNDKQSKKHIKIVEP